MTVGLPMSTKEENNIDGEENAGDGESHHGGEDAGTAGGVRAGDDDSLDDAASGIEAADLLPGKVSNRPDRPLGDGSDDGVLHQVTSINGLYENWFLDYASYVILDRAVPHLYDGLKPVQRRIMHSLEEMDDGRFNKVANVIGNTMKYHPHGDASIGDAMVQIGQKNLLIDTQGNWGDPVTGDSAAAPRYIEGRLSKFAKEVVFNKETTEWSLSYDGRNKEPVILPVKFPMVLAQGTDGIAVGLATKILPHNFIELIDASIGILRGETVAIVPDFPTGGLADFSRYNEGQRGGKVRVRARILEKDKKTLAITEVPYSTTTSSLIDSIVSANDKGKIKIRKIEDNTAKNVEILIHLAPGISPDVTIDALFAFTDCEVSISPNACVILDDKPRFMSVHEMLRASTEHTRLLLKTELEIRLADLREKWHFSSLEKIFIEKRIYRDIEECTTFEAVIEAIDKGLKKYVVEPAQGVKKVAASKFLLTRAITREDILRLTEIRIKRISKYDSFKADELLKELEAEIGETLNHLDNLTAYCIRWFERLRERFGKGRERKTEIRAFDTISMSEVALANVKLYINREDGFIGTGLKKDEFAFDCSDVDEIIVFRNDARFLVTKVSDKTFVGRDILYAGIFRKNDERTIYHLIYSDGPQGTSYMKRFPVTGITRDKEYDMTKGTKGSKVLYFSANPNGEAEVVTIQLKPHSKLKKLIVDINLAELAVKGRASQGNVVSKYPVKKATQKSRGSSTLGGRKISFDTVLQRLNADGRGRYLGTFEGDDRILSILQNGQAELYSFELTNHFDGSLLYLEKYNPEKIFTIVYLDGLSGFHYVKRFKVDLLANGKQVNLLTDHPKSKIILFSDARQPLAKLVFTKGKGKPAEQLDLNLAEFIDSKGMRAQGNRLSQFDVRSIELTGFVEEAPEPEAVAAEVTGLELEISNPEDIELDEGGQLGLF